MADTRTLPVASDLLNFLRSLRAVRQFRPEAIPPRVLDQILEVARWTGSSMNRQPWELLVVRDRATLEALAAAGGYVQHLAGATLAIVIVMAGEHPVEETFDEGRLSERIMLAAKAQGLGAALGWFQPQAAETRAKEILGVPLERTLRSAISLGYPNLEAQRGRPKPPQPRKPLADFVYEEHFGHRPGDAPSNAPPQ